MAAFPLHGSTVYVGTFVHSKALNVLEHLEKTAIGVNKHGVIEFIESNVSDNEELVERIRGKRWKDFEIVRAPEGPIGFWFPGFVDAHIHASQFPNAGVFGKSTLLDWLAKYTFPLEASLKSQGKARTVYGRCIAKTLAHGTTTAAYFATVDANATNILADLCFAAGQRAFIGRCNMDEERTCPDYYRDASCKDALAATEETISHIHALDPEGALIKPILTPRFALSCTPELLKGLGQLGDKGGYNIQTHISENPAEVAATLMQFPRNLSYTEVYYNSGLLTPRTVLAHGIHLNQEEIRLIVESKSTIAHCPASNSCLGSGICPVRELLEAGIPVGLGTDVSGGYSPSILSACREAGIASRLRTAMVPTEDRSVLDRLKLSVEETLHLATRGGARCLNLEQRVGAFEVGMEFDAQFVDLGLEVRDVEGEEGGRGNVEVYEGMGWEERLAKWVFCGDERNTRAVWVRGRLVSGDIAAP